MTPYYRSDDGEVVLYLGDSRDILPTLEAGSVDMVFTDPPFGHNNQNGDLANVVHGFPGNLLCHTPNEPRPIANDGPEANDLYHLSLPEWYRLLKPGCCCCCCCSGGGPDPQFARWSLWMDEVFDFKQMVVWDKGPMGMGWHYRRSYETVLVGQKPGAACKWYDTTDKIENVIRHVRKIIPSAKEHPTAKPANLAAHFILLHTQPGDVVLDSFMGAGSTAEACIRLGRRFVGVEISEEWAVLSRKRIIDARAQGRLALDSAP